VIVHVTIIITRMKKVLGAVVTLLAVLGIVAAFAYRHVSQWVDTPLSLSQPQIEVTIDQGMPPAAIAQRWVQAGLKADDTWLYHWFRWSGKARQIRAGTYQVKEPISPRALLDKMVRGEEVLETVRLLEGWTFKQFRAALGKAPNLKQTMGSMTDAQLMQAIGAPGLKPEGRFFPDTYSYGRGSTDVMVLKRAYGAMQTQLEKAWSQRASDSPLKTKEDALILASIVEKETGLEADRGKVAGVFNNRLRIGMKLQTDPTVIYGLGDSFDGNLRRRDLTTDTPFNTYTRFGLPPTPIAAPGAPSLRAAVNPEATKALYFVARSDGSGGSVFSATLDDHNRAVNRYQRGQ
jgi:UPF0755 protein